MTEKKRVACFFTAGYTELNSMKLFMRKINDDIEYIQLCPNGLRKSKKEIKNRHMGSIRSKQSGLTGQKLIDFIYDYISKPSFSREKYDAILIEDDKDDRFLIIRSDGSADIDEIAWKQHEGLVKDRLHTRIPGIPVLFFYAAPEVETWFLVDWDNSFGNAYKNILTEPQNRYFNTVFRKYVQNKILTKRYNRCCESYGYFNGRYKKLSTELQSALETEDFLKGYMKEPDRKIIRYSKRLHGEVMLENIDPQIVLQSCTYFFKAGLLALQSL